MNMALFDELSLPLEEIVASGLTTVEEQNRKEGRMWASDNVSCSRRLTLSSNIGRSHFAKDAPFEFYVKMGSAIEEVVAQGLRNKRRLMDTDIRIDTQVGSINLNLGGKIDILYVQSQPDILSKYPRIMEVKSCGSLPSKPKINHTHQALTYMVLTGLPVTLFYVSRDITDFTGSLLAKTFFLPYNKETVQSVLTTLLYAHFCNEDKVIPAQPDHMKKTHCKMAYCPFYANCWGGLDFSAWEKLRDDDTEEQYQKAVELADKESKIEAVDVRRTKFLERYGHTKKKNAWLHSFMNNAYKEGFLMDDEYEEFD